MEVMRNNEPEDNFLHKVRQLATDKKIVLIFDECSSGFRQSYGGLHKVFGVEPDMAMFGKALGNGYAITAIIGKREVMEATQTTFISSTFWSERIGFTAGIATLDEMNRIKSWDIISKKSNLERFHPYCKHNHAIKWSKEDSIDELEYLNGLVLKRKFNNWYENEGYDLYINKKERYEVSSVTKHKV